uniref:Uncharacterized protein n=1 Tax=Oryza punctata TaxID=4537 RepID=A0A0E0MI15_ORYPU
MALWVAVVTLGAQIKAMAGTGKREREKVRLLREQAENTRKILKLLEDKHRPTSPDPTMAGVLTGLRGALDDISSLPEKKPGELHALDQRISSILQQYHHYHIANNIHRDAPPNMTMQLPPPPTLMPWHGTPAIIPVGSAVGGSGSDNTGDWGHVVREIVEDARVTVQGAWYARHNMEEVLGVAQLAQQVADLLQRPHAASRLMMRDPEMSWPLLSKDLRDALRDARWIVWYSQWHHLSTMPLFPSAPFAGQGAMTAGGYPPVQPAQILDAAVMKIKFCLQVLPAVG